jgi:CubicO group peptidase (beta-lactamase class C family)
VAVLQLVEQGKLNLDADIDTYLAFPVRNPAFDKTAITLRMLLGLTSTIHDAALNPYFTTVDPIQPLPGDSTVTLATFLGDYLKVGGKDYSTADNFQTDENGKAIEPGTSLGYSDVGVALAAYIVEVVAKQPFDQYCKANIFTPLLMKDSAWHLQDLDKARLATGHGYDGQDYYAYKWYGYPYYAATTFYTTAGDYARVLMMMIGKGKLDAATVLKPESVALLTAPAFPKIQDDTYGLGWAESQTAALEGPIFGNEGGDYGFTSEGWFDPATKTGVVILGNGSTALDSYLNDPTDPDPDIDAAYSVLTDIIDASFAELQ